LNDGLFFLVEQFAARQRWRARYRLDVEMNRSQGLGIEGCFHAYGIELLNEFDAGLNLADSRDAGLYLSPFCIGFFMPCSGF